MQYKSRTNELNYFQLRWPLGLPLLPANGIYRFGEINLNDKTELQNLDDNVIGSHTIFRLFIILMMKQPYV